MKIIVEEVFISSENFLSSELQEIKKSKKKSKRVIPLYSTAWGSINSTRQREHKFS